MISKLFNFISDNKDAIGIIGSSILLFIFFFTFFFGNEQESEQVVSREYCEEQKELVRETDCEMIFEQFGKNTTGNLYPQGRDIYSGEQCDCAYQGAWWEDNGIDYQKGDTILKRAGSLMLELHKRDTMISYPYICGNAVYLN